MIKLSEILKKSRGAEFVRFGGLSPVKQKGFTTDPDEMGEHTPPSRHGIYAFPKGFVELFLLGGEYGDVGKKGNSNRFVKVKDKQGNVITNEHPEFDKYSENDNYWNQKGKLKPGAEPDEDGDYSYDDYEQFLIKRVHPKKFTHVGDIWHHLDRQVNQTDILQTRGMWVKTTMDVYKSAFKKELHTRGKEANQRFKALLTKTEKKNWFSKDDLEVFIERIK